MKNIGLLNFQYTEGNYGAVLQAAALEKFLSDMGYEVEHIDFSPRKPISNKVRVKIVLGKVIRFLKLIDVFKLKRPIGNSQAFERFREEYLNRTQKYLTEADLAEVKNRYDAVVVGSDQVWRPEYTSGSPLPFFLSFLGEDTRRISYAASFGLSDWKHERDFTSQVTTLLSKFHAVSVREKDAVDICKSNFGVQATHVLDPTLLIGRDYFTELATSKYRASDRNENQRQLSYYILDVTEDKISLINQLASKNKVSLIKDIYFSYSGEDKHYFDVQTWLFELLRSEYIVTDSFHCVCFALLFQKEFTYLGNPVRGMSRLESLLGKLNLTERIITDPSQEILNARKIDYDAVDRVLEEWRVESRDFLVGSLL